MNKYKKIFLAFILIISLLKVVCFCEENSEIIFDVTKPSFKTSGNWLKLKYDTKTLGTYNKGDSVNLDLEIPLGIYKIYFYKNLDFKGDTELDFAVSCTTVSENKSINLSRGFADFQEIGKYNISDGKINIKVTASGKGNAYISKIKLVRE